MPVSRLDGDIEVARVNQTATVHMLVTGDHTVVTPGAAQTFIVYQFRLTNHNSIAIFTFDIRSGSNVIMDNIVLTASTGVNPFMDLKNGGIPVLRGVAEGEALIVDSISTSLNATVFAHSQENDSVDRALNGKVELSNSESGITKGDVFGQ